MADLSSLSETEQTALDELLAEHAPDARTNVEAFADGYAQLELPPLSYWTNVVRGLSFSRMSMLGDDLAGLVDSLPQFDDVLQEKVDEAMDDEEYRSSSFGAKINVEQSPYTDEQIAGTDLDSNGVEQYTCFRDFTLEARSILRRANRYGAEALCRRDVYSYERSDEEHDRRYQHYHSMFNRLGDHYRAVSEASDDCEESIIFDDRGTPCETCQIPTEFDAPSLDTTYADMQP